MKAKAPQRQRFVLSKSVNALSVCHFKTRGKFRAFRLQ